MHYEFTEEQFVFDQYLVIERWTPVRPWYRRVWTFVGDSLQTLF